MPAVSAANFSRIWAVLVRTLRLIISIEPDFFPASSFLRTESAISERLS
jgi:hypothetical protein